jgi:hypothetical protein
MRIVDDIMSPWMGTYISQLVLNTMKGYGNRWSRPLANGVKLANFPMSQLCNKIL